MAGGTLGGGGLGGWLTGRAELVRGLKVLGGFAALALAGACAFVDTGVSFLGDPQRISFAMDRGDGWEDVAVHEGDFDSRTYDYRLWPGETVRVRAVAGETAVEREVKAKADRAYAMVASISAEDPTHLCFGCGVPVSVPIDPDSPEGERLWLYETFNGISAPIVF